MLMCRSEELKIVRQMLEWNPGTGPSGLDTKSSLAP